MVSVSAREVRNPLFQDLEISFSGWGSGDLQDVRWDAGTRRRQPRGWVRRKPNTPSAAI